MDVGDGNLPENEGVGVDVLKFLLLFSLMASLRVLTDWFAAIMTGPGEMRSEGSPRTQQFSSKIVGADGVIESA